ncbi:CaiB/BaiF CoA transferase family protein [Streptomyces sp. NPDC085946]|uniref:CaiB/BaiF CoA transferase family protein n=1 Tax=Streptomyces sp. NPDC085946 TaxID=3365744 RepID=UPI0037CD8515
MNRRPPLEGVRILAVEQYGAGPWGSLHLADLGAEVIKIEEPRSGGDVGRYVPPYAEGEDSIFFEAFNRNKRSISLDLTNPRGREVFERLVRESDAVYSNLRGDVPAKIGITYDDLKHLNPAIVCCSLSGYGMTGPRSSQPGYDYLLQGLAGWMDLTGDPGGPPTKSGVSLVDFTGGYVAALALLSGLHAAQRDGIGMDCDVSLYDVAVTLLNYPAAWHLNRGFEPTRTRHSAHPSLVPFQAFEARDGWIVVACPKEKFWAKLAKLLGHAEWSADPRFDTFAHRFENKDELIPLLEAEFVTRDAEDWLASLTAAGIPCSPINSVSEALREPHTLARDLIVETEHPRFGTVRQLASPVRVGPERPVYRRAPMRHEDVTYVTRDLAGYDDGEIEALTAEGAFGDVRPASDPTTTTTS